jgi:hypothetical protein
LEREEAPGFLWGKGREERGVDGWRGGERRGEEGRGGEGRGGERRGGYEHTPVVEEFATVVQLLIHILDEEVPATS